MTNAFLQTSRYAPWMAVIICMILVATTNGMLFAGMSVYDEVLLNEFSWSVAQLKARDSISFLGSAAMVIFVGHAVDKFGYKPPMLIGLLALALGYFLYSFAANLTQIYALHILLAFALAAAGNNVAVIAAASSMPDRRGLAVGITVAGSSIGGIILPMLATSLNQSIGWRMSMRYEAIIPLLILLFVMVALRNKIATASTTSNASDKAIGDSGLSYLEAMRSPQFYMLALASGLTFYCVIALFAHLFLYMRGQGFDPQAASLALGVFSLAALIGKLFSGWLADRVSPLKLMRFSLIFMWLGMFAISQTPSLLWPAIAFTALSWGGLNSLFNLVLLELFGMRSAGKIISTISIFQTGGAGIGAAATGFLFDMRGDYSLAFQTVLGLLALAALLALALRPIKQH